MGDARQRAFIRRFFVEPYLSTLRDSYQSIAYVTYPSWASAGVKGVRRAWRPCAAAGRVARRKILRSLCHRRRRPELIRRCARFAAAPADRQWLRHWFRSGTGEQTTPPPARRVTVKPPSAECVWFLFTAFIGKEPKAAVGAEIHARFDADGAPERTKLAIQLACTAPGNRTSSPGAVLVFPKLFAGVYLYSTCTKRAKRSHPSHFGSPQ
jgi:hypothetical protein